MIPQFRGPINQRVLPQITSHNPYIVSFPWDISSIIPCLSSHRYCIKMFKYTICSWCRAPAEDVLHYRCGHEICGTCHQRMWHIKMRYCPVPVGNRLCGEILLHPGLGSETHEFEPMDGILTGKYTYSHDMMNGQQERKIQVEARYDHLGMDRFNSRDATNYVQHEFVVRALNLNPDNSQVRVNVPVSFEFHIIFEIFGMDFYVPYHSYLSVSRYMYRYIGVYRELTCFSCSAVLVPSGTYSKIVSLMMEHGRDPQVNELVLRLMRNFRLNFNITTEAEQAMIWFTQVMINTQNNYEWVMLLLTVVFLIGWRVLVHRGRIRSWLRLLSQGYQYLSR